MGGSAERRGGDTGGARRLHVDIGAAPRKMQHAVDARFKRFGGRTGQRFGSDGAVDHRSAHGEAGQRSGEIARAFGAGEIEKLLARVHPLAAVLARSATSPSAEVTSLKPAARMVCALRSPTAKTGMARSSS